MIQQMTTRIIVRKNDEILLLRRSATNKKAVGLCELPGGKVDFGEDPEAAARREVAEETGLTLAAIQLDAIRSTVDRESDTQYVIAVYLAALNLDDAKVRLSDEHDRYFWKKMSDIQREELTDMSLLALGMELQTHSTDAENEQIASTVESNTTNTTKNSSLIVYTDGGSRGNPGPSASGFVVMDGEEHVIFEGGKYLGITTNNQAEYQAVLLGLQKAKELGAKSVQMRMDSQLVANQMLGIYQIKNRDLWPIYVAIKDIVKEFEKVTFTHVRREFNKLADGMVNKTLDQELKHSA